MNTASETVKPLFNSEGFLHDPATWDRQKKGSGLVICYLWISRLVSEAVKAKNKT